LPLRAKLSRLGAVMPQGIGDTWRAGLEASTVTAVSGDGSGAGAPRVPGLTVLAHPDARRVGERVALPALASGCEVPLSRLTPTFAPPAGGEPRPLADPHLSRNPLRLVPGPEPGAVRLIRRSGDGAQTAVAADGQALGEESGFSAAAVERGVVLLLASRVALLLHPMNPVAPREAERFGLIGDSPAMAQLRGDVRRVAGLAVPVLLRGETGTGKELAARAVHRAGPRRARPYLAVNMGAIPPALAAAELFCAARGAFTGADRRRAGYFRQADGGTLFLDEIGETPAEVQVLLLRALEAHEIQPVGAEAPERVDVRVIAATDADLEAAIAAGRFRAPLLHRLNGYEVRVPALRERREDFGRLLVHFLRTELGELGPLGKPERLDDPGPRGTPWLSAALVARLALADWPGNVRQLRNVARQIAIGSHDAPQAVLTPQVERQIEAVADLAPAAPAGRARRQYRHPSEVGEVELLAALAAQRWRLAPTAEQLGISRTSLYTLIDRCTGIRKAADLARGEIESSLQRRRGDVDAMAEDLRVSRHGLQLRMTELGLG
jgi:two-component system, NtrC family, nitrogen regulation response regulator GlnG